MDDMRWERYGAWSGILFLIVAAVAFVLAPAAPNAGDPTGKVITYFSNNRDGILWQNFLFLLSSGIFLWFLGSLRSYLRKYEGDTGRLATVAFGAGLTALGLSIAATIFPLSLALRAPSADVAVTRAFYDAGSTAYTMAWVPFAVMFLAAAVLTFRKQAFPAWLGWVGVLGTAGFLVLSAGIMFEDGILAPGGVLGYVFFPVFGVWVLAAAIVMIRRLGISTEMPGRKGGPVRIPETKARVGAGR